LGNLKFDAEIPIRINRKVKILENGQVVHQGEETFDALEPIIQPKTNEENSMYDEEEILVIRIFE